MNDRHRLILASAAFAFHIRAMLLLGALAFCGSSSAHAQGLGYAIAGPAGFSGFYGSAASSLHAAGGGEGLVAGRFGIGGEVGVFANRSSALLVVSANGAFHAATQFSDRRVVPFVTAGYTHFGRGDGSFSAWNAGVGFDVWMKDRAGLRLEVRDHVRPDSRGTVQYWTVRAGVVFR
jgi:hypothetical protein